MIQEFMTMRVDDYDQEVADEPAAILMENIESVYIATAGKSIGKTIITMKSGDFFSVRESYKDVVERWRICIEPININQ